MIGIETLQKTSICEYSGQSWFVTTHWYILMSEFLTWKKVNCRIIRQLFLHTSKMQSYIQRIYVYMKDWNIGLGKSGQIDVFLALPLVTSSFFLLYMYIFTSIPNIISSIFYGDL